jgi:hypothetical protein
MGQDTRWIKTNSFQLTIPLSVVKDDIRLNIRKIVNVRFGYLNPIRAPYVFLTYAVHQPFGLIEPSTT